MNRRKLLLNLFILKNPEFFIFYNYSDDFRIYNVALFNTYIFNDKSDVCNEILLGVVDVAKNEKVEEMFFVASVKYEEIFVFDKIELANFLEELGFDIFDEDYENEYDEEAKDDILRKNIEKALKIIENTLNNFSKENSLITFLKRNLHQKSILFPKLIQSNLYNKIKRGLK